MKTKYYIAYGSNMDSRQMAFRCPTARLVGTSEIRGYELLFKGSQTGSYATIEPKENSLVPIVVWRITKTDEDRLDIYEGFPNFYYKKNFEVEVNGERITAMAYIMDEKRKLGIPTNSYFSVLDRAYLEFGFDYNILEKACDKSMAEVYDIEE